MIFKNYIWDKRILGMTYWTIILCMTASMSGIVYAQGTFIDSAMKPIGLGRRSPVVLRGFNRPGLYHQGNRLVTSRLNVEKLMEDDAIQPDFGPERTGIVQNIEVKSEKHGQWTELEEGGWLWTMTVQAPGAYGVRLRIRPWSPLGGTELIIYDAHNSAHSFGPFTGSIQRQLKEFWTPIVYSNEVNIEYYLPPGIDHLSSEANITIDGVLNQYRALSLSGAPPIESSTPPLGELPCHLDVTDYSEWTKAASGVGRIDFISNGISSRCSGNLFNRIPEDFIYTPLFQTARHCISTQAEAQSAVVTWFFQTAANGTVPNIWTLPQTLGVVLLVEDSSTDYALLGLESTVPGGAWFLGWDAGYWSNKSSATGIHHPRGTHKRITFGTKTADVTSCIPAAGWKISNKDGDGEIEKGSSGSPIFDSSHRVRGTASCADWSCSTDNIATYGRLDRAYSKLEPFLHRDDPVEWNVYVDTSYIGKTEWGILSQPFKSVLRGVFAVKRGSSMFVERGTYDEQFTIDKPMTLYSRNGTVTIGQ